MMQACILLGGAVAPAGEGRLAMPKGAHRCTDGASLRQGTEYRADMRWRRLELEQSRAPACAHALTTGLADEILDTVGAPVMAVCDQRMHPAVHDARVRAALCAAGVACRGDTPWGTAPAPSVAPRAHDRRLWCGLREVAGLPAVGTIVRRAWSPVTTET